MFSTARKLPPFITLVPVCAGVFLAALDQTVVVTVLPQIMLDMRVQIRELDRASWTITGYLLGYTAAMPLMGRVSDVWGHRRIYLLSLLIFLAGSVLVAASSNLSWLVGARVFQAIGGGAVVPVAIAIVGDLFPPHRRGLALGVIGASAEAGSVLGPLWGGVIGSFLDWRWVFWLNIPIGVVIIGVLLLLVAPSPRYKARVDYASGLLLAGSLALLTLGLSRIGAPDILTAVYLVLSGLFFALFMMRQRLTLAPLLPLSMFKGGVFSSANLTHFMIGSALIVAMVTIPLMTDTVMGEQSLEGGLRLMRLTAAIPVGAILGGLACQRWDYRVATIAGLVLAALSFFMMSGWDLEIRDPLMTLHLALGGLGFGLVIAPIALAATNSVGVGDRGTAAAMVTAMRMVGMTVGLAALTAWGTVRFGVLVSGISLPLSQPGETLAQSQERVQVFQQQLSDAGMSLFNEFFFVAMVVCVVALVPAFFMAWRGMGTKGP